MFLTAVYAVVAIVMVISVGFYISFVTVEGKDERGQAIIGRSSQIAFIFILFGFVFQMFYIQFADPSVENIETAIYIWMALVWCSNSISIFILRRKS
ncbi:hypothetical protein [Lentibacillus salinarum]|uniref:DUF2178 domain-containing protein n=1 Tax=Lentibacillus salinarum TaxID=446820 RepID=A0ABW3ZSD7_9BACI